MPNFYRKYFMTTLSFSKTFYNTITGSLITNVNLKQHIIAHSYIAFFRPCSIAKFHTVRWWASGYFYLILFTWELNLVFWTAIQIYTDHYWLNI